MTKEKKGNRFSFVEEIQFQSTHARFHKKKRSENHLHTNALLRHSTAHHCKGEKRTEQRP